MYQGECPTQAYAGHIGLSRDKRDLRWQSVPDSTTDGWGRNNRDPGWGQLLPYTHQYEKFTNQSIDLDKFAFFI